MYYFSIRKTFSATKFLILFFDEKIFSAPNMFYATFPTLKIFSDTKCFISLFQLWIFYTPFFNSEHFPAPWKFSPTLNVLYSFSDLKNFLRYRFFYVPFFNLEYFPGTYFDLKNFLLQQNCFIYCFSGLEVFPLILNVLYVWTLFIQASLNSTFMTS